ncbi:MAG: carbon storage regulator [Fuerstiella sp.]|nr:carbon storage regulator [Fuerstiella sp.]
MLVLSRKLQEKILIPEFNISITVVSVGANRVQLGIDAPRAIEITRPDARHPANVELNSDNVPSDTVFASTLQLV